MATDPEPACEDEHSFTFWVLLFGFLNNIVASILEAIDSFFAFFYRCLATYIDFELKMTEAFLSMDAAKTAIVLLTVILLVNSALFWAWKMIEAALPWRKVAQLRGEVQEAKEAREKFLQRFECEHAFPLSKIV
ncbi:hypothetical protein TrVE_jg701 [Triparma verrucosa]|uniref:Uncharacterized protein n=1 Tax=Triparma verrucosa TaxID=1606542 RepID=A0A9W6ZDE0_9STRA|nr:hypothetical protein TrVE_jg701 [Triparma verrucosa]